MAPLLDQVEARVIGSLVEKQLTTPQQYPLSLNALTLACNQLSNRDPVVQFSEGQVESSLSTLKEKGLVRFVLPSHGRSVVRYRHVIDEQLALDTRQLALLAVLLLRGPQTVGELRARTERMASFETTAEVESDLEGLSRRPEPLVARQARRPGQKEERWSQLVSEEAAVAIDEPAQDPVVLSDVATLSAEVAELRREVEALRQEVAELRLVIED
jgi:uncharacterized protein YceH (UPF0502 family)